MNFSVLILAKNEERDLPDCLRSLGGLDDVVVLDSFSTDRTEAIARDAGARFERRAFDDFASQRNHALDRIGFRNRWVFHLDADERMTPALLAECEEIARADGRGHDGFHVASRMMLRGRWIRRASGFPAWQMRFARVGSVRFVQHGHGQREAPGARIGYLREPLIHHSFSKGLDDWFARHDRYSTAEAEQNVRELLAMESSDPASLPSLLRDLVRHDPVTRRRALKRLSVRLPARPALKFAWLYLARGGFLDGRAGLEYCTLMAIYEAMIAIKTRDRLERPRHESPLPGEPPEANSRERLGER